MESLGVGAFGAWKPRIQITLVGGLDWWFGDLTLNYHITGS